MEGGGSGCWLRLLGSEARRKRNRNRQLAKWRARMTNDKGTNDKGMNKAQMAKGGGLTPFRAREGVGLASAVREFSVCRLDCRIH